MILPKVGVIIGVANINAGFVAIVASIQHQEAKIRQFFTIIDVKQLAGTPKTLDLAIFVLTTDNRQTNCFTPCACAWGNRVITTSLTRQTICEGCAIQLQNCTTVKSVKDVY